MFAAATPSAAMRRLLLLLALAPACSVVNNDHCANLEGDATCQQRDPSRPFCSQCAGENNGCFIEVPPDTCHAVTVAAPGSSSTAATTTAVDPTTGGSEGQTTSSTTTPVVTSTTGDPDTTASSSTGDSSTTTSTTGDSSSSTTTTTTTDTSSSSSSGSDSSSSTGAGPVCGDNMIEGDEVCDGGMLDNQSCAKLLPAKWGGGTLKCTDTCKSFDDTACCIGVGQACNYLLQPDELCCPGLDCPLSGKCTVK